MIGPKKCSSWCLKRKCLPKRAVHNSTGVGHTERQLDMWYNRIKTTEQASKQWLKFPLCSSIKVTRLNESSHARQKTSMSGAVFRHVGWKPRLRHSLAPQIERHAREYYVDHWQQPAASESPPHDGEWNYHWPINCKPASDEWMVTQCKTILQQSTANFQWSKSELHHKLIEWGLPNCCSEDSQVAPWETRHSNKQRGNGWGREAGTHRQLEDEEWPRFDDEEVIPKTVLAHVHWTWGQQHWLCWCWCTGSAKR